MQPDPRPIAVLHLGFHKTGTTSLQAALNAHAAQLRDYQIATPQTASRALRDATHAARFYSAHPRAKPLAALRACLMTWVASLEKTRPLLLSSEDFAGHMPGNRGVSSYAAAPAIAQELTRALEPHFAPRLLLTIRAPQPWLRSIHWQNAKHDHMLLSAEAFATTYAEAANFAAVLEDMRARCPQVLNFVALEDQTRPLGPVEALYDLAEIPPDLRAMLQPVPPVNLRPPYDLAAAFVALNTTEMPKQTRRQMKDALLFFAATDTPTPMP